MKFRGCSVGQTLQWFVFSCFIRGSDIWASFAARSWSANGQLGTNCLQDDRLFGLSYVPPSPVKDFLSVPTSPASIFVLKLMIPLQFSVRKILQWPLFLFFFFNLPWNAVVFSIALLQHEPFVILMPFYPINVKKLRKYVFLLTQSFDALSFRGGALSEEVLGPRQNHTACTASSGWSMAGRVIEHLKLQGTHKDHKCNDTIDRTPVKNFMGKGNASLSPEQDNVGRNTWIPAYLSIRQKI